MPAFPQRLRRFCLVLATCALAAGCGSLRDSSHSALNAITPYKAQVVQGNFVSREQVEALRTGMSREQVREILGTPLVASAFHANRWDYVFTLKRQGIEPQARRLSVFFGAEGLQRFEGDPMPSESEFVALLEPRSGTVKVPVLEATESQLERFPPPPKSAAPTADAAAPPDANYPPLETPAR